MTYHETLKSITAILGDMFENGCAVTHETPGPYDDDTFRGAVYILLAADLEDVGDGESGPRLSLTPTRWAHLIRCSKDDLASPGRWVLQLYSDEHALVNTDQVMLVLVTDDDNDPTKVAGTVHRMFKCLDVVPGA